MSRSLLQIFPFATSVALVRTYIEKEGTRRETKSRMPRMYEMEDIISIRARELFSRLSAKYERRRGVYVRERKSATADGYQAHNRTVASSLLIKNYSRESVTFSLSLSAAVCNRTRVLHVRRVQ